MRRTIREMRRTGRWKISNSIATQHTPWHENSTPRSSRVYAFPPLTTSSRLNFYVKSQLVRLLFYVYMCMCVCVEYLLHQQYSSVLMRGSLIDFIFHFISCSAGGWRLDAFDTYFAPFFSIAMGFFLFNDLPFGRWNQNVTIIRMEISRIWSKHGVWWIYKKMWQRFLELEERLGGRKFDFLQGIPRSRRQ